VILSRIIWRPRGAGRDRRPGRPSVRHIPLSYSFDASFILLRSPKRLAYALLFAPVAAIGPVLGHGDALVAAAARA